MIKTIALGQCKECTIPIYTKESHELYKLRFYNISNIAAQLSR